MSWRVKLRMKYLTGILNNYRISSLNDTEKFELFIIDNENFLTIDFHHVFQKGFYSNNNHVIVLRS